MDAILEHQDQNQFEKIVSNLVLPEIEPGTFWSRARSTNRSWAIEGVKFYKGALLYISHFQQDYGTQLYKIIKLYIIYIYIYTYPYDF